MYLNVDELVIIVKTMLVSDEHHEKLQSLKVIPRESYDAVIGRLLQDSETQKGVPE